MHRLGCPDGTTWLAASPIARGDEPADLVLRGGRVFSVFTGELLDADVAIAGEHVAGVGGLRGSRGPSTSPGLTLLPGFIDGHMHLESTKLMVDEFARAALPVGHDDRRARPARDRERVRARRRPGAAREREAAANGADTVILERDRLPTTPEPRKGVPQGRQAHVLLHRGLLSAEELLPGLRADLLAAGCGALGASGAMPWLGEYGWLPTWWPGFELISVTRPLLEHLVRQRLLSQCRRDGCTRERPGRRASTRSSGSGS